LIVTSLNCCRKFGCICLSIYFSGSARSRRGIYVLSSICSLMLSFFLILHSTSSCLCEYCSSIDRFRNVFLFQYLLLYFLALPLMPDIFEFLLNMLPHCHLGTILKLVLHFHSCPQTVPSAHVTKIPYLIFLLVLPVTFLC